MAGSERDLDRPGSPPTLVVADDRPVVRAGLTMLLRPLPVRTELPLTGLADALAEQPDVDLLVVGVRDDDHDAFASIAAVTAHREVAVVAVADSATVIELREAVIAGVDSFLLSSATGEELRDAVRRTLAGERVVAPSIAMQLASVGRLGEEADGVGSITRQELDVLSLAADGMTNEAIAQELGIGSRTVKTRIQNVLAKLEVPDRTAAVARAIRLGLIN